MDKQAGCGEEAHHAVVMADKESDRALMINGSEFFHHLDYQDKAGMKPDDIGDIAGAFTHYCKEGSEYKDSQKRVVAVQFSELIEGACQHLQAAVPDENVSLGLGNGLMKCMAA